MAIFNIAHNQELSYMIDDFVSQKASVVNYVAASTFALGHVWYQKNVFHYIGLAVLDDITDVLFRITVHKSQ